MEDNAIILAIIPAIASLILGLYNAWIQYQKSKIDKPVQDANVTSILTQASQTVAKQYGELLDRVKQDFQEKLLDIRAEMEELKEESREKDKTIAKLEFENEQLKARVAELETELKSWKEIKTGPISTKQNTGPLSK